MYENAARRFSSGNNQSRALRTRILYPKVAKAGGLQSQGAKGEAVVNLLRTLGNAVSGVLRLSRWVNNMAKTTPSFEFIIGWKFRLGLYI